MSSLILTEVLARYIFLVFYYVEKSANFGCRRFLLPLLIKENRSDFNLSNKGNIGDVAMLQTGSLTNNDCDGYENDSDFIALIPSRSSSSNVGIFSGVEFYKTVSKFRKRKRKS